MAAVNNNKPVTKPSPQPAGKPNEADKSKGTDKSKAADKPKEADKPKAAEKPKDDFKKNEGAHVSANQKNEQEQKAKQAEEAKQHSASASADPVPELGDSEKSGGAKSEPVNTKATPRGSNDHKDAPAEHHSVNNLGGETGKEIRGSGNDGKVVKEGVKVDTMKDPKVDTRTLEQANDSGQVLPKKGPDGKPLVDADELLNGNGGERYPDDKTYPSSSKNAENPAQLAKDKQQVFDSAKKQGATDAEAAILTAQLSQEGGLDLNKEGDGPSTNYGIFNLNQDMLQNYSSDGKAKNGEKNEKGFPKSGPGYEDMETINPKTGNSLGSELDNALKKEYNLTKDPAKNAKVVDNNVAAALNAMHNMGVDNYLHHVRGGDAGYKRPQEMPQGKAPLQTDDGRSIPVASDDADRFARNIANAAMDILYDKEHSKQGVGTPTRYAGDIPNI